MRCAVIDTDRHRPIILMFFHDRRNPLVNAWSTGGYGFDNICVRFNAPNVGRSRRID